MQPSKLTPRLVPALLVKDMTETLAYYRKLGFELTGCHPDAAHATWAELARDGIVLQFHGGRGGGRAETTRATPWGW